MMERDQVIGLHRESVSPAAPVLEIDFENTGFQYFHDDSNLTAHQAMFGYVP